MNRPIERFRSTLIWIVALPIFGGSCTIIWLASFFLKGRPLERLIKFLCRLVLFVCGIRIRVSGHQNIVPGRRYVVMMNHVNFFDPMVIYAAFPGHARAVEEERHFRWPIYGPTIRRLGVIPIDRKDSARAKETMLRANAWVRAHPDFSFIILPEGTRTPDGRLGPFKRGGFLLAIETGLEILPMVQVGAFRINRKGSRLLRPGRIEMFIEPGISSSGYTKDNIGELIERVRAEFFRYVD